MNADLRVPFVAAGHLRSSAGERAALVCELSRDGLRLQVEESPTGEAEVRFPLPDGGPPVAARAVVRWTERRHDGAPAPLPVACGVELVGLSDADRERIARVVERYRKRPTPVLGIEQPRSGLLRVPFVEPCTLRGARGERRATTCNLSVFGAYVALDEPPAPGEELQFEIDLASPVGRFERRATVTWRHPESRYRPHTLPTGCGLRFEELTRHDLRQLSRFVDSRLEHLPRG